MTEQELEQLGSASEMIDDVYRVILHAYDIYSTPRDYGTGRILNMVEMHTLSMIAEEPGLRVTDIAQKWNRTLGAASKNVNRLCQKGYVEKKKLPGDDKTIHIYPTELGQQLADMHRKYDRETTLKGLQLLLEQYSLEDLYLFHDVLVSFEKKVLPLV